MPAGSARAKGMEGSSKVSTFSFEVWGEDVSSRFYSTQDKILLPVSIIASETRRYKLENACDQKTDSSRKQIYRIAL